MSQTNRKHTLMSLSLFFTLMHAAWSTQVTPTPDKPELWNRAVSAYALGQNLIPGRLNISFSLLSGKGDVTENHEREVRYFWDEKTGKLQSELLWARDKGKDTTKKAQADEKKQQQKAEAKKGEKKRSLSLGHDELPLALKRQPDVRVDQTSERRTIEGRSCLGFNITMEVPPSEENKETSLLKGRAWIDEERGLPMELTLRPDPLPSRVKAMNMTYTFHEDPNRHWVVKAFTMEGSGGFLFIKKHFRSQVTLSDYFPHSKPE
jgi:hypothetical protein